jgi:spermidine synthase
VRRQLSELALALAVFGPPTILMGMVFAHLLALLAAPRRADEPARPVGAALAINGLCAAAAPLVLGLLVLGRVDYAQTWAAIAWGYLLLALALGWARRFAPRVLALLALVGLLGLAGGGSMASSLALAPDEDEGWVVVEQREAALGLVRVSETTNPPGSPARPLRRLWIDRHFRMGGALAIGDRRMGHIPLLLAGEPSGTRVLFLGLGTGATAGTALAHEVEHVDAVELVGEVVDMLPHFASINAGLADDPRATIVVADARRYLLATDAHYHVIVADLFHPAREGAASLYAREHFEAARARLDTRGVFVQWLPLHQLDEAGLALIVRTFLAVFPDAHAWLGLYNVETPALALIGSVEPLVIDAGRLSARLAALQPVLDELALTDLRDLLGGYMLDRAGLEQLGGVGPLHEDLRPRLDFVAARATIGATRGLDTITRLLALRRAWPDALVVSEDPTTHAELRAASARFAAALALYLEGEGLRLHAALAGEGRTRAQLEPYLAAYVLEPEFVPPRTWLYAAAQADRELAEWLLPTMLERTPDEPRVHRAWLAHLARSHQQERFNLALGSARTRLGEGFDPGVQPIDK